MAVVTQVRILVTAHFFFLLLFFQCPVNTVFFCFLHFHFYSIVSCHVLIIFYFVWERLLKTIHDYFHLYLAVDSPKRNE